LTNGLRDSPTRYSRTRLPDEYKSISTESYPQLRQEQYVLIESMKARDQPTTLAESMNDSTDQPLVGPSKIRRQPWNRSIAIITIVTTALTFGIVLWLGLTGSPPFGQTFPLTTNPAKPLLPVGVADPTHPSGMAPPSENALPGFTLDYSTDFAGSSLPKGWYVFTGIPGGDPGGHFAATHVVVDQSVLHLNAWKDPAFGNKWVTGGLCQCGLVRTYGAYFVRSRITGAGPSAVELLWPATNTWPPEIDFNETGGRASGSSSTVHWSQLNLIDQHTINIDMTKWHTWGVIWTAKSIQYTVDGIVWGAVTTPLEIPNQPMRLDFEQRALCVAGRNCPTTPVSMLVDWVAEYSPK